MRPSPEFAVPKKASVVFGRGGLRSDAGRHIAVRRSTNDPFDGSHICINFDGAIGTGRRWLHFLMNAREDARILEHMTCQHRHHAMRRLNDALLHDLPHSCDAGGAGRFAPNADCINHYLGGQNFIVGRREEQATVFFDGPSCAIV